MQSLGKKEKQKGKQNIQMKFGDGVYQIVVSHIILSNVLTFLFLEH